MVLFVKPVHFRQHVDCGFRGIIDREAEFFHFNHGLDGEIAGRDADHQRFSLQIEFTDTINIAVGQFSLDNDHDGADVFIFYADIDYVCCLLRRLVERQVHGILGGDIGRNNLRQIINRGFGQLRQAQAFFVAGVGAGDAHSAGIGDQQNPGAYRYRLFREGFCDIEQVAVTVCLDDPALFKYSIIDRGIPGQGSSM